MSKTIQKDTHTVQIDNSTLKQLKESFQEEAQTLIHCSYVSKKKYINGGWVNIYPTTYLVHNKEILQMLHAESIPVAPSRHFFKKAGELKRFTLVFPSIPKDWDSFDLIERCSDYDGFMLSNIKRNDSGVYEARLH